MQGVIVWISWRLFILSVSLLHAVTLLLQNEGTTERELDRQTAAGSAATQTLCSTGEAEEEQSYNIELRWARPRYYKNVAEEWGWVGTYICVRIRSNRL